MKIALTQACLKVKCYFLFFYCRRQRYSRNSLQAKQSFAESFLHALLFLEKAGSTMRAILRSSVTDLRDLHAVHLKDFAAGGVVIREDIYQCVEGGYILGILAVM